MNFVMIKKLKFLKVSRLGLRGTLVMYKIVESVHKSIDIEDRTLRDA